ncbi:hypothetical protein MMC17_009274 [Xylographa soralifera]|nr:hypothetical protein [Xylographa soralifera]
MAQNSLCARCHKFANRVCAGCKSSPSYAATPRILTVYYCSRECQVADWLAHKPYCKASSSRRSLYRAADTIQKAFLIYREVVFDKLFTKVEERNGLLLLTEGCYARDDIFVPFPKTLVKTELDRQAILTHLTCNDALGWMHDFISKILEGLSARLEEYSVKGKNHRRSTVVVCPIGSDVNDSRTYQHDLLKVTLPGGQAYALDTTSAQYGYYKPLIPWDDFFSWRVDYVIAVRPFGSCKMDFQKELDKNVRPDKKIQGKVSIFGLEAGVFYHNHKFSTVLNESSNKWLMREGLRHFSKVLGLTLENFEEKAIDLLGHFEKELKDYRDCLVGEGRLGKKFGKGVAQLPPRSKGDKILAKPGEGDKSETGNSVEEVVAEMMKLADVFIS